MLSAAPAAAEPAADGAALPAAEGAAALGAAALPAADGAVVDVVEPQAVTTIAATASGIRTRGFTMEEPLLRRTRSTVSPNDRLGLGLQGPVQTTHSACVRPSPRGL